MCIRDSIIAASQLSHLLGVDASGENILELGRSLLPRLGEIHWITVAMGALAIACLIIPKKMAGPLKRSALPGWLSAFLGKSGPVLAVLVTTLVNIGLGLDQQGLAVVGAIPDGLPQPVWPSLQAAQWHQVLVPALLLALIGFVESISLAQALAAKRRERINANRELLLSLIHI